MTNLLLWTLLARLAKYWMAGSKIDRRLKIKALDKSRGSITAIVQTKALKNDVIKHFQNCGANIKYELPFIESYVVEIPCENIKRLASHRDVIFISDDSEIKSTLNIATKVIGSNMVNDSGYTGKGIGIAFLDTGVYPHPDLTEPENRIVAFKDFINKKEKPYDDNGHGTHVAGDAAGNGYSSDGKYKGIAPEANIIAVKVLDARGTGNTSDILAGMQWILDNADKYNIRIVSMSLGDKAMLPPFLDPMSRGCERLWRDGLVVTVAAGNNGPDPMTITTPGISPSVITVGALDDRRTIDTSDDTVADFSSRGPTPTGRLKPDVLAPGVNIVSLNRNPLAAGPGSLLLFEKLYRTASGTSMATPMVAGAAALLLQKNPNLTPNQVKKLMQETARPVNGADKYSEGYGLIDINAMLKQV